MPTLSVRDFSVRARLGCAPGERNEPQEVRISLDLTFPSHPLACASDRLADTVCYAEICARIRRRAETGEFHTVERLHAALRSEIEGALSPEARFRLRVHKPRPPIEGLLGGVIFRDDDADA